MAAELCAMKLKQTARKVGDSVEETPPYTDFPIKNRFCIRTNNVIERLAFFIRGCKSFCV